MTNKKTKLSEETKEEIKGIVQGTYETVVIVPETTKREQTYDEIIKALQEGKYFVMREGYTRASVYGLLKKIKEKSNIDAMFGITENNGVKQFALFVKKEQ